MGQGQETFGGWDGMKLWGGVDGKNIHGNWWGRGNSHRLGAFILPCHYLMVTMTVTMTVKDHNCNHYRYHQLLLPSSFVLLDHFLLTLQIRFLKKKSLGVIGAHFTERMPFLSPDEKRQRTAGQNEYIISYYYY